MKERGSLDLPQGRNCGGYHEIRHIKMQALEVPLKRLKEANNELRKKIEGLEGKNNLLS